MIESLFTLPAVMARHRQEPFGSYIDGFTEHLSSQGYSHSKVRHAVEVVSRFGRWLHSHKHGAGHVSRRTIEGFGQKHLLSSLTRCGGQAALYSLLEYLQLIEVTAKPDPVPKESEPIRIEREFSHFLQEERALSSATVKNYSPIARLFLVERFGRRHVELSKLSPCDVHDFISRHAHEYSRQRTQLILTALRSFLRFLYLRGRITAQLGNHVLTVAGWRMSTVPKWLNADDIERVVGCCDYQAESGQRDHAILLLLARLGLRAGEIVALELEDVRWDAGEITVCGKGQQRKRFPLPEDVGHVLASYLKNARPQCSTRRIFVKSRAPYQGLGHSSTVSTIVRRALARAGIDPPYKGAHLFRHSLATNMLRKGATLSEIGQILHHKRPDTTAIYAKVDFVALRELVLPWPGDIA